MSDRYPDIVCRSWLQRARTEHRLRHSFLKSRGHRLNTRDPRSFSEKLFCRMIAVNRHDDRIMTELSDKLRVRDYVAYSIGKSYLANLFWYGTDMRCAPFEALPSEYMVKANHGSRMSVRARHDYDRTKLIDQASNWMKTDFASIHDEFQYYGIDRHIFIEEILYDSHDGGPLDYRLFCFDGVVELIQVEDNARSSNAFYDRNWTRLAGGDRFETSNIDIERPAKLAEMLDVASRLSRGIDFVRVDLYNLYGRIVVGEMTFTPVAGSSRFHPASWDHRLGERWQFDERPLELREAFSTIPIEETRYLRSMAMAAS